MYWLYSNIIYAYWLYTSYNGTFATLGKTGGSETHKITTGEMPAHTHNINGRIFYGVDSNKTTAAVVDDGNIFNYYNTNRIATNSAGSGNEMNIMNPYVVINFEVVAL